MNGGAKGRRFGSRT